MERTLEARWFYRGAIPQDVRDWFDQFDPELESEREDLYMLPADPALNVKLREGKVEVKRCDTDVRRVRFHEVVGAQVEPWVKWSFPLAEDAGGPEEYRAASNHFWKRVKKRRYQRVFEVEEQKRLFERPDEHLADVEMELTEVQLEGDRWWSLCIESTGDEGVLYDALDRMARYAFEQGHAPTLEAERSCGYAQWIMEASGAERPAAMMAGSLTAKL